MSWAITQIAINSDIKEPLNYLHYINNVAVFGTDGYVINNPLIMKDLMINSLNLYHDKIARQIAHNGVEQEDIDFVMRNSTKLADQMNAFYDNQTEFTGHDIDDLVGQYIGSGLEGKFKQGYVRYVNDRFSGTIAVGAWLNSTFDLNEPDLDAFDTFEAVVVSGEVFVKVIDNEAAFTAISNSEVAITALSNSEDFINMIINDAVLLDKCIESPALFGIILKSSYVGLLWDKEDVSSQIIQSGVVSGGSNGTHGLIDGATSPGKGWYSQQTMSGSGWTSNRLLTYQIDLTGVNTLRYWSQKSGTTYNYLGVIINGSTHQIGTGNALPNHSWTQRDVDVSSYDGVCTLSFFQRTGTNSVVTGSISNFMLI